MKLNIDIKKTLKSLCLQPGITGIESESGITGLIFNLIKDINNDTTIDKYGNIVSMIGNNNASDFKIILEAHMDEFDLTCNYPCKRLYRVSKDGTVSATALDNRVGCLVLIELIKWLKSNQTSDIHYTFLFSANEETKKSKWDIGIGYNFGIVIDAAYAKPIIFDEEYDNSKIPTLGKGCAIQGNGKGFIIKPKYVDILKNIAKKSEISTQDELPPKSKGYTNFAKLKYLINGNGLVINIPVRNQHQQKSTASFADIISALKLIHAVIENIKLLQ